MIKYNCLECGILIPPRKNTENKYCSNKCQKVFEYKRYIEKWLLGEVKGHRGKNFLLSRHVIRYLREKHGDACQHCGWCVYHPVDGNPLTVFDHIDGDAANSHISNIRILCPNCHSMTETYGRRNKVSARINRYP